MTRVLVIGGYGTFGIRLVRLLSEIEGVSVLVAGRSLDKAAAAIADINGAAELIAFALDRSKPLATQLTEPVKVIVDAVGPFQAYGKTRDYVFDYACKTNATYIDLSDDPGFCSHIADRADDAPITVATGWSTYSAVTGAAWHALGGAEAPLSGIVPSPRLPMGRAVIESVLSYAGRPIAGGHGLTRLIRRRVAPPGTVPMRSLLFSNVATPDSILLHPDACGFVAPQPVLLHRLLVWMSRLAHWKLLPPLRFLAGMIHSVQSWIRTGEPRGGLFVECGSRRFDLIGEGDLGPYVPVIPAAALIQSIHHGERPPPGLLRPGRDFPLERLTPWFDKLGLSYGMRENDPDAPLYDRALGGTLRIVPEPVQALHECGRFKGEATVSRGRNPLARLVCRVFRFPPDGHHDVIVELSRDARGRERWSRTYSGREMFSTQELGRDRLYPLILERFGPVIIHLAAYNKGDRLYLTPRGWSLFGLPLPRWLGPTGHVFESVDDFGRFTFHVDIQAPLLGRLVKYEGWLVPDLER